jgi:flagellar biosynthesis protein FlhB
VSGWRAARAVLLTGLAAVGVTAAVRGVLVSISEVFDAGAPLGTMTTLAASVGWPLLIMLLAVAVLDAIADRVTWLRGASMTRREYEEEMRETQGHPLTRERRAVSARRREDA